MQLKEHETTEQVIAEGSIYGLLFDGTSGCHSSINFYGKSLEEVELAANKALEDGSIDSGMGFESIKGALLDVWLITTIEIEGYTFSHDEEACLVIGELTDAEIDSLRDDIHTRFIADRNS